MNLKIGKAGVKFARMIGIGLGESDTMPSGSPPVIKLIGMMDGEKIVKVEFSLSDAKAIADFINKNRDKMSTVNHKNQES